MPNYIYFASREIRSELSNLIQKLRCLNIECKTMQYYLANTKEEIDPSTYASN